MTKNEIPTFLNSFVEEQQKEISKIREHFIFVAKLGALDYGETVNVAIMNAISVPYKKVIETIDLFKENDMLSDYDYKFLRTKIGNSAFDAQCDIENAILEPKEAK